MVRNSLTAEIVRVIVSNMNSQGSEATAADLMFAPISEHASEPITPISVHTSEPYEHTAEPISGVTTDITGRISCINADRIQ